MLTSNKFPSHHDGNRTFKLWIEYVLKNLSSLTYDYEMKALLFPGHFVRVLMNSFFY